MAGPGRARILAIDVVRGLAVVGMLPVNNPGIPAAMPQELRHAPWQGLTVADQVFPLFLCTIGASMAAFVDRVALGQFSEHGVLVMVSSSVSVLAGVAAGRVLLGPPGVAVTRRLLALGAGLLGLGLLVAVAVPIGKPLWTPSFVLVTAGISALVTAAAYRLVDQGPGRSWSRPLVAAGGDSFAALAYATGTVLVAWALAEWLYWRRVFIRV